ncbi:DinB family protein [Streptomyces sp. 21So2-11]|uniref:DinB family protein n=1 Tax=Streptomyces sp. 21So2-11 TaxID=3144408 RepID=UPI00321B211D
MTTPKRTEPSTTADERSMLDGWLDHHRETLAWKCSGLDDAQLRQVAVPPSELSLLGLVRHMAEVERGWFRRTLAGEEAPALYYTDEDPDADFHLTDADTWEEANTRWQAEIAHARGVVAGRSLDDLAEGKHRSGETFNLRWIYTHMIEEYARHNGHADLIRQRVDGMTGE